MYIFKVTRIHTHTHVCVCVCVYTCIYISIYLYACMFALVQIRDGQTDANVHIVLIGENGSSGEHRSVCSHLAGLEPATA